MCNVFGNRVAHSAYLEEFAHLPIPLVFPPPEAALTWSRAMKSGRPTRLRCSVPQGAALHSCNCLGHWRPAARRPRRHRHAFRGPGICPRPLPGARLALRRVYRHEEPDEAQWRRLVLLRRPDRRWAGRRRGLCPADGGRGRGRGTHHARRPVVLDRDRWAAWLDDSDPADLLRPADGHVQNDRLTRTTRQLVGLTGSSPLHGD